MALWRNLLFYRSGVEFILRTSPQFFLFFAHPSSSSVDSCVFFSGFFFIFSAGFSSGFLHFWCSFLFVFSILLLFIGVFNL